MESESIFFIIIIVLGDFLTSLRIHLKDMFHVKFIITCTAGIFKETASFYNYLQHLKGQDNRKYVKSIVNSLKITANGLPFRIVLPHVKID